MEQAGRQTPEATDGGTDAPDQSGKACPTLDWSNPDYRPLLQERLERLTRIRREPACLPSLFEFYGRHPIRFIADWGVTADPRNALLQPPRMVVMPFVLWPRQHEWLEWVLDLARSKEPGLTEKSRDCGVSWLAIALSCTLCIFRRNLTVGFGSATEIKIDRTDDPFCLFSKARMFMEWLPPEFRPGWHPRLHSAHLRLVFPWSGSAIIGEAGDNIGRGGRSSIFFVDESAHLQHPQLVEASLLSTTDCRIDLSSVRGMDNPFARKRHAGKVKVFTFHWRHDPRKGVEWHQRMERQTDAVTLAAEIDIDYHASIEGVLIPSAWVQAAIGAHTRLGLNPTGATIGGLDVADEGKDKCALAGRHGVLLNFLQSWSGRGSTIYRTTERAFGLCDLQGLDTLWYDADGLGAGVRGDAVRINEARHQDGRPFIVDKPFRGSGAVFDPEGELVRPRKNKDYFANVKAQSWWWLRLLFQNTYRAVVDQDPSVDPEHIICIDPQLPELTDLMSELSQPTYSITASGKILVDKQPDIAPGVSGPSPNLADAVMICFNPGNRVLDVWRRLAA